MARKLDKNRPFGDVYGHRNARYEQFGILFDTDGIELPGFERVQIPKEEIPAAGNNGNLAAELAELREQNGLLQDEIAGLKARLDDQDTDAAVEEVQGKLDTANVEVARLAEQVKQLTLQLEEATAPGKVKGAAAKGAGQTSIDDQLKAQGVA